MLVSAVFGQEPVVHGRVVGVTDGDTLKILVADQQLLRVRLAFCDAPEKRQVLGTRAKQAMSELAFVKEIELRPHAIDRYGRTVAQVFVDGKDVGMEILRKGFAWVYGRYITEASTEVQETYRIAPDEAKAERLGLWSDPNSIPPWIFRNLAKADQQQTLASKDRSVGVTKNPDDVWATKSDNFEARLVYTKIKREVKVREQDAVR